MNESKWRVADLSQPVNPTEEEIERFWSKVDKTSSPHGCWLWIAGKCPQGYGAFFFRGQNVRAPRFSWVISSGPILPDKPWILHNCPGGDNPTCINPDHLWCGTFLDNDTDMRRKGRHIHGATHPSKTKPWTRPRGDNHWTRLYPDLVPRGDRNGAHIHPEKVPRGNQIAEGCWRTRC